MFLLLDTNSFYEAFAAATAMSRDNQLSLSTERGNNAVRALLGGKSPGEFESLLLYGLTKLGRFSKFGNETKREVLQGCFTRVFSPFLTDCLLVLLADIVQQDVNDAYENKSGAVEIPRLLRILDWIQLMIRMTENRGDWTTDSQIRWLKHTFDRAWPHSSLVRASELNTTYLRPRWKRQGKPYYNNNKQYGYKGFNKQPYKNFGDNNSGGNNSNNNINMHDKKKMRSGYCRMYNGIGYCSVKDCRFRHRCQKCDGDHPACQHV